MMDFEQLYEHEFAEFPYEVVFEDYESEATSPKFKTWQEALDAQVKWNKELSGHRDRKRK
jgi:hypothetical protein